MRLMGQVAGVYQVPSSGGAERRLATVHAWFGSAVDWSPDGQWLVVSDAESAADRPGLSLLSPHTLERRVLTRPPAGVAGDGLPAFSPDGQWVAFVRILASRDALTANQVMVVPTAGGEPRGITTVQGVVGGVDWSADSRSVLYSPGSWPHRLWKAAVAGGDIRPIDLGSDTSLTEPVAESVAEASRAFRISAAVTRDRLVYSRGSHDTDIWRIDLHGSAPPLPWLASTRLEDAPDFSPDGRRVAFASTRVSHLPEISTRRLTAGVSGGAPRRAEPNGWWTKTCSVGVIGRWGRTACTRSPIGPGPESGSFRTEHASLCVSSGSRDRATAARRAWPSPRMDGRCSRCWSAQRPTWLPRRACRGCAGRASRLGS